MPPHRMAIRASWRRLSQGVSLALPQRAGMPLRLRHLWVSSGAKRAARNVLEPRRSPTTSSRRSLPPAATNSRYRYCACTRTCPKSARSASVARKPSGGPNPPSPGSCSSGTLQGRRNPGSHGIPDDVPADVEEIRLPLDQDRSGAALEYVTDSAVPPRACLIRGVRP